MLRWFSYTSFLIVMTNYREFKKKLQTVDFQRCVFSSYTGKNSMGKT